MNTIGNTRTLSGEHVHTWQIYVLDSVLAFASSLFITGLIALFHLYPLIPNISIVYLLAVLALATTRGRYAAIFASVVAFFAFNFFLIPPYYTFVMPTSEWIALIVFLITAVLTGYLASALRQQAQHASRREHETHVLYDLVRETNREEMVKHQLQIIVQTVAQEFSSSGIQNCTILQPDPKGTLHIQASIDQTPEQIDLPSHEQIAATWVMEHNRSISMFDEATDTAHSALVDYIPTSLLKRLFVAISTTKHAIPHAIQLIPLSVGQQVVGVLRLNVAYDTKQEERNRQSDAGANFFWTVLDQAASLIERARLRSENLRLEILQRTDTLRTSLLSAVSHDLRTPLTVIKTSASSLLEEDIQWTEEEKRSIAQSIEREADRLNRLVGNLLDMSRIEDGALQPDKDLYQLTALVQDVVERLQPLLQGRTVHLNLPDNLPSVEVDYLQIDQVITNLIENAVRYTPATSPIEVEIHNVDDQIILQVADRGPGIAGDDRSRIFDKFYRVLGRQRFSAQDENASGLGLGLAVCKGLVEAHGGTIWVEPRQEGGTIFFVALPVATLEGSIV